MKPTGKWIWLYLALVALTGAAAILWLTPRGAGISPDSTVYLASAQSLLAGTGYAVDGIPVTHFPPLFPRLLAFVGLVQRDLLQAARLLNALIFAVNLGLIAWLSYLASGRRFGVSLLATVFALTAEPILELHAWAWSEPLFIALVLTSVLFLIRYVPSPQWIPLVWSAIAMGLAIMTRYIGIGLLLGGVIIIYLARPRRDRRMGLRDAAIWFGISCLPLAAFLLRNLAVSASIADRSFAVHPMTLYEFTIGVTSTLSRLVALDTLAARLGAAAILLIAVYLILPFNAWSSRLREQHRRSPELAIPFSCLVFCVAYLPFLYVSLSFLDASTPLDARILAPVLVLLVVSGFAAVHTLGERFDKPYAWTGLVVLMLLIIVVRAPSLVAAAAAMRIEGLGYTSRQWTESPTVRYARTLPESAVIYSNAPDVLRFLDGRTALPIPSITNALTIQPNPRYAAQLDGLCRRIAGGSAYLVYFDTVQPWNQPTKAVLESTCGLSLLTRLPDGAAYGGP